MSDVTHLLNGIDQGDPHAASQLLPLVYDELRLLARNKLAHETPGQTLDATALVHEAYLRLVGNEGRHWDGRRHFFAAAAKAMRRILVDNARRKKALKHAGGRQRVEADPDLFPADSSPVDLLALDEALTKFAKEAPAHGELVQLRFFAGFTMPEAAHLLGISLATAERHWAYARSWLYAEMSDAEDAADPKNIDRVRGSGVNPRIDG
jgi:RNA polymerase sigma factor (TIGR02999 family)